MFSLDSLPERVVSDVPAYDRSSVYEFLDLAEAERVRLQAAVLAASERRLAAERALLEGSVARDRLELDLRTASRSLEDGQSTTWHSIAVILASADTEADAIVAEAREHAEAIRAQLDARPALDLLPGVEATKRAEADVDLDADLDASRAHHPASAPTEARATGPRLLVG